MDSGLDEWEARAHQTLTDAEQAFLMEDFKKGFSLADSILQEYLMLSGGPSTLDVDQHPEHIQDFMSACIAVCIQCMYEQGEGNKVDDFLKRYYSSLTKMPLQQFVLWSKLHFHLGNYSTIVEKCIEILKTKKFQLDPHLNEGMPSSALLFICTVPRSIHCHGFPLLLLLDPHYYPSHYSPFFLSHYRHC